MDQVILQHPYVAEAATFPVPEPMLGQVAETAVVLQASSQPQPEQAAQELRDFAKTRLADHKVSQVKKARARLARMTGSEAQTVRWLRSCMWEHSFQMLQNHISAGRCKHTSHSMTLRLVDQ